MIDLIAAARHAAPGSRCAVWHECVCAATGLTAERPDCAATGRTVFLDRAGTRKDGATPRSVCPGRYLRDPAEPPNASPCGPQASSSGEYDIESAIVRGHSCHPRGQVQ